MIRIKITRPTVADAVARDLGWVGDVQDRTARILVDMGKAVWTDEDPTVAVPTLPTTKDFVARVEAAAEAKAKDKAKKGGRPKKG